ncbi:MAG TPA: 16S rRNA (guanine(966)-N(2))-methyltransferase RsmD [Nitrospirae bacterium]|nr:ribosomal RNA small subunit methyltransferase D [bacterium BMS3Abin09]HDZ84357.1 16S rRNA (guanine(966)-N(2))-methyltransferase RsmD [Nitrospirota bacterium]
MGSKMKNRSKTGDGSLRPTTNKVREALFDIIREEIRDALFLDLYSGTGNIGINAVKQGASGAVIVEANKTSCKEIIELAGKLNLSQKVKIHTKKVLSFIEWAELNQLAFDIIFLDPPYHTDDMDHALSAIDRSTILNDNGMVIAEHFKKRELPERLKSLEKERIYHYGDTVLTFYTKALKQEESHE